MPCTIQYDLNNGGIVSVVNSLIPDAQQPPSGYGYARYTDAQLAAMGVTNPNVQLSGDVVKMDLSQNPPVPVALPPNPITQGVTITSAANPAINGNYAIDSNAQLNLNSVMNYTNKNGVFPGGGSTFPWIDLSGAAHSIPSIAVFDQFATAIADYVFAVNMWQLGGSQGAVPSNALTIP